MIAGHLLLKKPEGWKEAPKKAGGSSPLVIFKNKTFIGIWTHVLHQHRLRP